MQSQHEHLASNIGVDTFTRLSAWGQWVKRALKCTVRIYGSALRSKDFNDVDVALLWPDEQFDPANRFFRYPEKAGDPDAWWLLCSALSLQASEMSGVKVEVQLYRMSNWRLPSFQYWEVP